MVLKTGDSDTLAAIIYRLYHNTLKRDGRLDVSAGRLDLLFGDTADRGYTLVG